MPFVPEFASRLAPRSSRCTARATASPATSRRDRPGRRWRQHRIPDRQGAGRDPQGLSLGRLTPDAAAAEDLGRDLFWWLTKTGVLNKTVESRLGRKLPASGDADRLEPARAAAALRGRAEPRAVGCLGPDGPLRGRQRTRRRRGGLGHRLPARLLLDRACRCSIADGRVRHRRGVTDMPGLYFLGLTWQHTRGSALIGWVKDDAAYIAEQIKTVLRSTEQAHGRYSRERRRGSARRGRCRHKGGLSDAHQR